MWGDVGPCQSRFGLYISRLTRRQNNQKSKRSLQLTLSVLLLPIAHTATLCPEKQRRQHRSMKLSAITFSLLAPLVLHAIATPEAEAHYHGGHDLCPNLKEPPKKANCLLACYSLKKPCYKCPKKMVSPCSTLQLHPSRPTVSLP